MARVTQEEADRRDRAVGAIGVGFYVGFRHKREYECTICGVSYWSLPYLVWKNKKNACNKCTRKRISKKQALTLQQVDKGLKSSGTGIRRTPGSKYVGVNKYLSMICHCGKHFRGRYSNVMSGNTKSCGRCNMVEVKTGDKFGKLTVIELVSDTKEKNTKVICDCDCGNIWGPHPVWYLYAKEKNRRATSCGRCKVLRTGDRSGKLTVKKVYHKPMYHPRFKKTYNILYVTATCDCGKQWSGPMNLLQNGNTKSCGHCLDPEVGDIINELTIIAVYVAPISCRVDAQCNNCGTIIKNIIWSRIRSGQTKSCGCIKSHGERIIKILLNKYGIQFLHNQKDCKQSDKYPLEFDFVLNDGQLVIEYQGIQHYKPSFGQKSFLLTTENDQTKRDYCTANDITLWAIPYTEFDNLEELITELIETGKPRKLKEPKVQSC